jgi:hypothetical protein
MPGRATYKRARIGVLLIAGAILATGCASADHSWRGEFDARLGGAIGTIEEEAKSLRPDATPEELLRIGIGTAHRLAFKSELIAKLDPPSSCDTVEEEGEKKVSGSALFSYDLEKNMTPYLARHFERDLKEEVADLKGLEREAETCE